MGFNIGRAPRVTFVSRDGGLIPRDLSKVGYRKDAVATIESRRPAFGPRGLLSKLTVLSRWTMVLLEDHIWEHCQLYLQLSETCVDRALK